MLIRKFLVVFGICLTFLAVMQAEDTPDNKELLKQATFSIEADGAKLNFVLLNNKTVEALFTGSSKYSIRARASASTVFYIDGVMNKTLVFNPDFDVEQDGTVISTKPVSIKNFKKDTLEKGTKIQGLLELEQKLNLYRPFKLKNKTHVFAEFQYDWDALEAMKN
ncbi:MAG: hypothetical protein P8Z37_04515 [Acidobacteriota bacterium]